MKRMMLFLFLVVFAVAGACSEDAASDDDDNDDGAGATGGSGGMGGSGGTSGSGGTGGGTAAFSLTVDAAEAVPSIDTYEPDAGDKFVVLALTLSNYSVSSALPVAAYFDMRTVGALQFDPSALSTFLEPDCPDGMTVAQGGQFSCRLAFELPEAEVPSELLYDDLQGHATSVPVPDVANLRLCTEFESCPPPWHPILCGCESEMGAWGGASGSGGECETEDVCYEACTGTVCECLEQCSFSPSCRALWDAFMQCMVDDGTCCF